MDDVLGVGTEWVAKLPVKSAIDGEVEVVCTVMCVRTDVVIRSVVICSVVIRFVEGVSYTQLEVTGVVSAVSTIVLATEASIVRWVSSLAPCTPSQTEYAASSRKVEAPAQSDAIQRNAPSPSVKPERLLLLQRQSRSLE